jgi:hypothetical protein
MDIPGSALRDTAFPGEAEENVLEVKELREADFIERKVFPVGKLSSHDF